MRNDRGNDQLRDINIERNYVDFAEGSCLISFGKTRVLCTATVEEKVPKWLEEINQGWVTAEYSMLPRANRQRNSREAKTGKQSGRTMEIQRLIGRALRAVVDLKKMSGVTITLDCDVIQADGGTRCASICGSYIALYDALNMMVEKGVLKELPLIDEVAAVSVGLVEDEILLDLDYAEDSSAQVDLNLIMTGRGDIVEVQGTAEGKPFSEEQLLKLLGSGKKGIKEIIALEKEALGEK